MDLLGRVHFQDAGCVDGLLIGDEGDQYGDSHRTHQFNVGTWGSQNQEEFNLTRYSGYAKCIYFHR